MRQKYDPKYSEEKEFDKKVQVSKIQMQALMKNKKKKLSEADRNKPLSISAGELGV